MRWISLDLWREPQEDTAVPPKKIDAETVSEELCEVFARFGIPAKILSDRGSNFLSKITEFLLEMLKVIHIRTSPYHPETSGMLERFRGTLKVMLRKMCPKPKEWDQ